MKRSNLIHKLDIFRAVMECGSMVDAARALGLSQPAVSQHVTKLEHDLKVKLFFREHGRLVATTEALVLLDEVAASFENFDRLMSVAQNLRLRIQARLSIAVPHSFCAQLVPRVINALINRHPQLRFTVQLGGYPMILGVVAARKADVGIVRNPYNHPGVDSEKIATSRLMCVLPKNHPLSALNIVRPHDLGRSPLILLGRETVARTQIEALFAEAKVVPNIRVDTQSVGSACTFVREGVGIALVSELLAAQYAMDGCELRPLHVDLSEQFSVIWPVAHHQSSLISEFADQLRAECVLLTRTALNS
jgi:DNA-binding transcriptional LysR family regulator